MNWRAAIVVVILVIFWIAGSDNPQPVNASDLACIAALVVIGLSRERTA